MYRRAFTLIELLDSIVIIAVLIAHNYESVMLSLPPAGCNAATTDGLIEVS